MLLSTARRSVPRSERLRASYVEISRFVHRATRSLPSQQLALSTQKCVNRNLHSSRKLYSQAAKGPEVSLFKTYKESLSWPAATHEIEHLRQGIAKPGDSVVLHGYLGSRTDLSKNLSFVPLFSRDLSHSIQIVSSAKPLPGWVQSAHGKIKASRFNTPVVIKGVLKGRDPPATQVSLDSDVGKIDHLELELLDVQLLNEFPKDIIFTPDTVFPPEERHLQIRQDKPLRDALAFRARAAFICRKMLNNDHGFTEIETPMLFKSTPEGAREFIVPTRRLGLAYALPQSPQQFKQILMASGISRYYQMARCFRDEDLRADRQPEFTQLDLEMAFANGEDVMNCMENLIRHLWGTLLNITLPQPFTRMTYHGAMSKYGSDKPDVRFDMPIHRIGHLLPADLISKISPLTDPFVEAILFRLSASESGPGTTRKFVTTFMDSPEAIAFNENSDGGPGIFIYDSRKPLQGLHPFGFEAAEEVERLLEPSDGDLIVLQARKREPFHGGSTSLGNLRLALHRAAVAQNAVPAPDPKAFAPLWITDFPLFSPISATEPGQGGTAGLASTHHPFTSPKTAEDVDLLLTEPSKVIGDHYDLVINGVELGGGSRRIHNAAMQRFIMEKVLKMKPERIAEFSHLLEALRAGCPPHAGIALGFDRLIAVMLGTDSVRDVIAFPKNGKGEDLMVKSPSMMSEEVLKTYHLRVRDDYHVGRG